MFGLFHNKDIDSNARTEITDRISAVLTPSDSLSLASTDTWRKLFFNSQIEKLFSFDINNLYEKMASESLTTSQYYRMIKHLAQLFNLPKEEAIESLDEAETEHVQKMATSLEGILGDNNDHDQFEQICLNTFYHACHKYLLHRPNGLFKHINIDHHPFYPENDTKHIHYYGIGRITTTFKEHKKKTIKDIKKYLANPAVSNSLKILNQVAPALQNQRETIDEHFSSHKNSYDDVGKEIGTPLFLTEIFECLSTLEQYQKKKANLENIQKPLNFLVNKTKKILSYNHISELLRVIYGPPEILANYKKLPEFDLEQIIKLSIPVGIAISKKLPYNLIDLDFNLHKKKLDSNKKIDSNEHINCVRNLAYAGVPWIWLRNAAFLYSKLKSSSNHNDKILVDAVPDIAPDYEIILKQLKQLIYLEILISTDKSNYIDYQDLTPCPTLNFLPILSQYAADIIFSNKIISLLSDINLSQDHPAETYMRILGVLGECGKNISEHARGYLQNNFWNCITDIRDKIAHSSSFYKKLETLLSQKNLLVQEFRADLLLLKQAYQDFRKSLPDTWTAVKQFYSTPINTVNNPLIGIGTINLYDAICPTLTPQDIQELNETKTERINILKSKNLILSIINKEIPANTIDQNDFKSALDELNGLSKANREKLYEYFKKLRSNKATTALKNGVITPLLNLQPLSEAEIGDFINKTIRALRSFTTSQSLIDKLKKYDFNARAIDCWELKRNKLFQNETLSLSPNNQQDLDITNSTINKLDQGFSASIDLAKHLEKLRNIACTDITSFMDNISESYRVENYFVRARVYIETIRETINYLKDYSVLTSVSIDLAKLYSIVEYKLESMRLYGNSLAHLHDETELTSVTTAGRRFFTYNQLIGILDGYKVVIPSLVSQIKTVALIIYKAKTTLAAQEAKQSTSLSTPQIQPYSPPTQPEPSEDKRNDPDSIHFRP